MSAGARTHRLFVGIELDRAAREGCAAAAEQLQSTGFTARYEHPDKFHVTLAFLGNVFASQFDGVVAALTSATAARAPLAVTFDKLGAFPHERKPRVVYLGAREQGRAFRSLAQSVQAAYVALGFTFDEDAIAHVTIARVKETRHPLPALEFVPIPLHIERVTLFESLFDPGNNTSRYEARATAPLLSGSSGD